MKKIIATCLSILFISITFAQTGWKWAKNAESSNNSDGFSISKIVDDHVYVCGEFFGPTITFGSTTLTNAGEPGSNDLFLVKYDLAGNVSWAKSVGGSGSDFARSVAIDKTGNIYIAGGFTSTSVAFGTIITLTNPGSTGTHDIFVAKYDPDGNVIWAKSIGGNLDDKANCIATDSEGDVCVIGWFGSKYMLLGNDSLKNQSMYGSGDVFVIKLNSAGEPLWWRTATGYSEDYGYGIATDHNNNIYITGGSSSPEIDFNGVKIANPGYEKMYIAKYSPKGDLLFAQSVGGSNNAEGTGITADNKGNVYITGKFSSSITLEATTLTNAGAFDVYIAKYNSDGALQWATSAGGIADERGNSIITDEQGNAYITGWYSSTKITFGKTYLDNPGDKGTTHMFVAKYSPDGVPLWSESAKGKSDDWGNGITLDKAGNVYVTGGFDGIEMNFSTTKFRNPQGNDFYITKLLQP